MDWTAHLAQGLAAAGTWQNLLYILAGCLLGTLAGVLPRVGPLAAIALLLPAAHALPAAAALIMLAGVYCGAHYGSLLAAVSLPDGPAPAHLLDASQMARRDRAGPALAAAGIGALIAGGLGIAALAALAGPLSNAVAAAFGPAEYFALMVLGLAGAVALARGSLIKAIGMAVLGLLLGLGSASASAPRLAPGLPGLTGSVGFSAIAIGLLCIGPIIASLAQPPQPRQAPASQPKHLYPTIDDCKLMLPAIARGTLLGGLLGLLPGSGALLAPLAASAREQQASLKPGEPPPGKGNVRGVAGPQAASSAAMRTAFIPLLALGLPLGAVMALLAGVLVMHGIQPGPQLIADHTGLFWCLIASMLIGSLMLAALHLPLAVVWAKLLPTPYRLLFPALVLACASGMSCIDGNAWNAWLAGGCGIAGYIFIKLDMEPAPLLLGLVLGPAMQENLRAAVLPAQEGWSALPASPLAATMLALAAALLAIAAIPAVKRWRQGVLGGG